MTDQLSLYACPHHAGWSCEELRQKGKKRVLRINHQHNSKSLEMYKMFFGDQIQDEEVTTLSHSSNLPNFFPQTWQLPPTPPNPQRGFSSIRATGHSNVYWEKCLCLLISNTEGAQTLTEKWSSMVQKCLLGYPCYLCHKGPDGLKRNRLANANLTIMVSVGLL